MHTPLPQEERDRYREEIKGWTPGDEAPFLVERIAELLEHYEDALRELEDLERARFARVRRIARQLDQLTRGAGERYLAADRLRRTHEPQVDDPTDP